MDNSGRIDAGADLGAFIEEHWEAGGVDLTLAPGVYLIETPVVVRHSSVSIQGYAFGFSYPRFTRGAYRHPPAEWAGKTELLVAPTCRDAIQIGPRVRLAAFTLRNLTIRGQNGRAGRRPDIDPEQNGIRIMPDTKPFSCVVDYCQLIHLTHGIINEHPESTMDVWYITDNWIAECNVAIKMHSSLYGSVISRNGFHDMSGTVFELRSVNHSDNTTKEMVLSDNTGWNPGKLVFDLEGFRGGNVSDNAFMFNHGQVQCFARLRSCYQAHVTGNTFVVDGKVGEGAAMGYEQDGERYDILTMAGCADCTVSGNTLLSFHPERPVLRLGAHPGTGEKSHHNHILWNKVLPSEGYEERPQVELTDGAEANLVVPAAAGEQARRAVRDAGHGNQVGTLPLAAR